MAFDAYAAGTLMIMGSGLLAVVGLLAVRKTYSIQNLITAHDISGQYLSIVGTMYAVLLGLIVVDAMSRFQQAVITVEDEANSLSELVFLAGRMPPLLRARVQQRAVAYTQLVIDREWPSWHSVCTFTPSARVKGEMSLHLQFPRLRSGGPGRFPLWLCGISHVAHPSGHAKSITNSLHYDNYMCT